MRYLVVATITLGSFNPIMSSQLEQDKNSEKNQSYHFNQPNIKEKDDEFLAHIFEKLKSTAKKIEYKKQDFDLQKKRVWVDSNGNEVVLE